MIKCLFFRKSLIFIITKLLHVFFKNWDSFHVKLNSHYKVWSCKKKKYKKIKAYRKYVYKDPTAKSCLLILDLKPFRS